MIRNGPTRSRRGGGLKWRGGDGVVLGLRIARVEMRLQRYLGEMFETFGLAEKLPVLERPVGRLLATEGRQRTIATYVLHETLPRIHKAYYANLRQADGGYAKHLLRAQPA